MSLTRFARIACGALLGFSMAFSVHAQIVSSKGMATIVYEGKLKPADRQAAMQKANLSALEAYVAQTWLAKVRVFAARRDDFVSKLDRLVLGSTILSESENKQAKTYSVVVRSEINAALLQVELDSGSATVATPNSSRSPVAMLFLARMQGSVQSFQAREYRRTDMQAMARMSGASTERTHEGESIGDSHIGTSGSISRSQSGKENYSAIVETGGSTTQKADKISWNVTTSSEINTAMTGVFSGSGYEVVEAEYLESMSGGKLSIDRIRGDFSRGNDLSPDVLRSTVDGIRQAGVPYLAVGTLDVGIRDQDPVSGLVRVTVTVTGKVLDVTGRFPRTISSVGPIQYAGVGNTETVARTNALTQASEKAARVMVDELNARAVR
ncbi:MAG TPA: hypothetical protein VEY50_07350 [Lysobacter sp.]|nr:hypothetical protein [Lysobacter sp.]